MREKPLYIKESDTIGLVVSLLYRDVPFVPFFPIEEIQKEQCLQKNPLVSCMLE